MTMIPAEVVTAHDEILALADEIQVVEDLRRFDVPLRPIGRAGPRGRGASSALTALRRRRRPDGCWRARGIEQADVFPPRGGLRRGDMGVDHLARGLRQRVQSGGEGGGGNDRDRKQSHAGVLPCAASYRRRTTATGTKFYRGRTHHVRGRNATGLPACAKARRVRRRGFARRRKTRASVVLQTVLVRPDDPVLRAR